MNDLKGVVGRITIHRAVSKTAVDDDSLNIVVKEVMFFPRHVPRYGFWGI